MAERGGARGQVNARLAGGLHTQQDSRGNHQFKPSIGQAKANVEADRSLSLCLERLPYCLLGTNQYLAKLCGSIVAPSYTISQYQETQTTTRTSSLYGLEIYPSFLVLYTF